MTVQEQSVRFELASQSSEPVHATVVDVYPYASYHQGMIGYRFNYETPRLAIELESTLGDLFVEFDVDSLVESELYQNMRQLCTANSVDVAELVGETVHIAFDDELKSGTISLDQNIDYRSTDSVYIRDHQSYQPPINSTSRLVDTRSIEWLNRHLEVTAESKFTENGEWIERTVKRVTEDEDTIRVQVPISGEWLAQWEFSNSFAGMKRFREFTNELNLPQSTDEVEGSIVYLHPFRNLPSTLSDTVAQTDRLERWVISDSPLSEPDSASFFERMWDMLTLSSKQSVSVSSNTKTRVPKSGDKFDVVDLSTQTSSETEPTKETIS